MGEAVVEEDEDDEDEDEDDDEDDEDEDEDERLLFDLLTLGESASPLVVRSN